MEARTAALMREGTPKSESEGSGKGPQKALPGAQHRSLRQQILGPTISGARPAWVLTLPFFGETSVFFIFV